MKFRVQSSESVQWRANRRGARHAAAAPQDEAPPSGASPAVLSVYQTKPGPSKLLHGPRRLDHPLMRSRSRTACVPHAAVAGAAMEGVDANVDDEGKAFVEQEEADERWPLQIARPDLAHGGCFLGSTD